MKYIFIVNQIAGRGKYKKIVPHIEKICKEENKRYAIRYITEDKSGADIAREYCNAEHVIYVVGGDGTLTRTLAGIIGTKNKLGIIPAGSGNDTYRTIKSLPQGISKIDLAKINDTYFINVACCGMDAEVANNIDKFRNTIVPASQMYNVSIIYTFFNYRFKEMKLKTEVKTIQDKYSMISICNGGYYGGGFNVAPKSKLTDGILDIYYAEKMPRLKMIPLLLKMKKGKHEGKRKMHKYRSKHIELEFEQKITFNVDGEKLSDTKFTINVLPEAIEIYNDNDFVKKILEGKEINSNKKLVTK